MKYFKLFSAIFVFLFANQALGESTMRALASKVYQVAYCEWIGDKTDISPEVRTILDSHAEEVQEYSDKFSGFNKIDFVTNGVCVWQVDWLPNYYIKGGIERYSNSKRLKNFISKNNIDSVAVAEKYLYHVPGRPYKLSNDNYLVIAKEVFGKQPRPSLTDKQKAQLKVIATTLPHKDLQAKNFVISDNGVVTIIDTDRFAMPIPESTKMDFVSLV